MESPAVIAEPASKRDSVGPQSVAAVLRGFQSANRGCRTPRGVGDRSANPQIAVRFAPPPAGSGLSLGSGPRIPGRRAQSGHEAADGSLPSHFCASARWRLLFPGDGSSLGESAANWAAARGTANPSQGWDSHARYSAGSCSVRAGRCPRCDPVSTEPSSRAESAAPARSSRPKVEVVAAPGASSVPSVRRSQSQRDEGRRRAAGTLPQTLVCKAQPRRALGARSRSASSRPGGRRRPRLTAGLLLPLLLLASKARARAPRGSCPSPTAPGRRARGLGGPGVPRGRCPAPGDILRPGSVQVVALGAEAPRAPGGLWSATGFSTGLFPAAAAASGHTHPRGHSKDQSCNDQGPENPRRGEVTFPGLPPARPLPPQRHAWLRRWETLLMPRGWGGVPDDRLTSSGPRQARLRDLEGQGNGRAVCIRSNSDQSGPSFGLKAPSGRLCLQRSLPSPPFILHFSPTDGSLCAHFTSASISLVEPPHSKGTASLANTWNAPLSPSQPDMRAQARPQRAPSSYAPLRHLASRPGSSAKSKCTKVTESEKEPGNGFHEPYFLFGARWDM